MCKLSTLDAGGPVYVLWSAARCGTSYVAPEPSLLVAVESRLEPAEEVTVAAELRLDSVAALPTFGTATFGFGFGLGLEPDL